MILAQKEMKKWQKSNVSFGYSKQKTYICTNYIRNIVYRRKIQTILLTNNINSLWELTEEIFWNLWVVQRCWPSFRVTASIIAGEVIAASTDTKGIIGTGGIGRSSYHFTSNDACRLVALCDVDNNHLTQAQNMAKQRFGL